LIPVSGDVFNPVAWLVRRTIMHGLRGPSCGIGRVIGSQAATRKMTKIDEELLRILACPDTHTPLVQVGDWLYSTDPKTRRKYPIRDGIPVLLIDESQVANQEEFERVMATVKHSENPKKE